MLHSTHQAMAVLNYWQQAYIFMALTILQMEASSLWGSVAYCQPIVLSRQWLAHGANCRLSPLVRAAAPAIEGAYFLCLVNEISF